MEEHGLCDAEVRKNIVLVELGKPLTIPLSILNENCEFRKQWNKAYNKWHPDIYSKAKSKAYQQRPDVKAKRKAYLQRPDVKAKRKAKAKAYYQRPDVKAKAKAYRQRPDAKAKRKAKSKAYQQRPDVKAKRKAYSKAYSKAYYQRKKLEKINEG